LAYINLHHPPSPTFTELVFGERVFLKCVIVVDMDMVGMVDRWFMDGEDLVMLLDLVDVVDSTDISSNNILTRFTVSQHPLRQLVL
jgi:hypothetical protein